MFMKKEFELKYLVPPYALKLNCPMDKEPVRIEIWSWQANQTNKYLNKYLNEDLSSLEV